MPTENFLPQTVVETAGIFNSTFGSLGIAEVAWTNPSQAVLEDDVPATCTTDSSLFQNPYTLVYTDLLAESDGTPIASKIGAGATITAMYIDVKCAISANTGRIYARLRSAATSSAVGTSKQLTGSPSSAFLTWYQVLNGTIFGDAATTTDVRGTEFGAYIGFYQTASIRTFSVDQIRVVISWTEAASTTTRPRRQNIRLKDGRIAAVRARVR